MGVQIQGDTGNVIATKGTFSGDVGIGGTLTYEDVTNIDAVGLVTARNGIEIGARPGVAASISVDGNMIVSGISTFQGLGDFNNGINVLSNVTISDSIVHDGDDNTKIRFPSADTITAETGGSERVRVASDGKIYTQSAGDIRSIASAGSLTLSGGGTNTGGQIVLSGGNADSNIIFKAEASTATPTERLRITSAGKVGISTASPNARLHVLSGNEAGILIEDNNDGNNAPYLEIMAKRTDANTHQSFSGQVFLSRNRTEQKVSSGLKLGTVLFGGNHTDGSKSNILYAASIAGMSSDDFDSASDMPTDLVFFTGSTGRAPTVANVSSGSERFRITSSGDLYVNTASKINAGLVSVAFNGGTHCAYALKSTNAGGADQFRFFNSGGTQVGSIAHNNSNTSFNTSSDYRLKENISAISDGITRLKTLKPSRFNFKSSPSTTVDGFLAHEVTAVPEAIKGTKDEVDSDNNPVYQGIDQSKLVPLLTAALQESVTEIESLKSRLDAAGL